MGGTQHYLVNAESRNCYWVLCKCSLQLHNGLIAGLYRNKKITITACSGRLMYMYTYVSKAKLLDTNLHKKRTLHLSISSLHFDSAASSFCSTSIRLSTSILITSGIFPPFLSSCSSLSNASTRLWDWTKSVLAASLSLSAVALACSIYVTKNTCVLL